ncbi:MAG: ferritin-like domain-containing protein [Labilithrix sp.]|nr:ferritin-like domain-containing protein [Labilithrix sp.]
MRSRTISYASLLSLVSAACGGIAVIEVAANENTYADASSTSGDGDDAAAANAAPLDAAAADADVDVVEPCPGPTDPRWAAGTVPARCGLLLDGGECVGVGTLVTPELACALRHDDAVCHAMSVCAGCSGGPCRLPWLDPFDNDVDAGNCGFGDGPVTISCWAGGRRPHGLASHRGSDRDAIAHFLSASVWLEAASVVAFERLGAELRAFGAPEALARACDRAAVEEAEHATALAGIATRYGARRVPPRVSPFRERSLFELARENVVEGCVKETFAAAVAVVQSIRAEDRELRGVMKKIAIEEATHADLARRIDHWARTRLAPEEVDALDAETRDAARSLAHALPRAFSDARLRSIAGLPTAEESTRILAALAA